MRKGMVVGVVAAALVGCGSPGMVRDKVLQQASFDLRCGRGQLAANKISVDGRFMGVENATWGVEGCGRQATYKTSCGGMTGVCSVMSLGGR